MDLIEQTAVGAARADVELRLPADAAFVSVLRTAAAGLAARMDFTIEDIEELRMAVSEAFALVLDGADPGADLTTAFYLGEGRVTAAVSTSARTAPEVDEDGFAWQVLEALTTTSETAFADGVFTLTITVHSVPPL